jgi:hypothetical protein
LLYRYTAKSTVDFGRHDEIVLVQTVDLLRLQRNRYIAPTELDVRMVPFTFRDLTDFLNKT